MRSMAISIAVKGRYPVMCGYPLYAVNMLYYHWLIKKLLQPIAGQNIARLKEIYGVVGVKEMPCSC